MSTFGPSSELRGGMLNGVGVDDQHGCVSELEPGASLGEEAEPTAPLGGVEPVVPLGDKGSENEPGGGEVKTSGLDYYRHCHHHHLLYSPGTHPPPGR